MNSEHDIREDTDAGVMRSPSDEIQARNLMKVAPLPRERG